MERLATLGLDLASQNFSEVRKWSRYLECLRSSQTDISVSFSLSDSTLSLDWDGELTYQVQSAATLKFPEI